MSNYNKLSELLNTTSGMTVLRNNSGQDDGVDTVTGADWFKFDGAAASTIYVSGNSFVGFGSNTEHLKICRRDGKMWYLYRQEGVVGIRKFLKIRWEGYTRYNYTSTGYSLKWELFLFDDGGMYLNLIDVPDTSGYLGDSILTYSGGTLTIPVTLSTPVKYSVLFENGGYTLSSDDYPGVSVHYVSSGSFEHETTFIQQITSLSSSKITWDEDVPEGTSVNVYTKLSTGEYSSCDNGGSVLCLEGHDLSTEILHIKIEMSTTNQYITPTVSNMQIQIVQDDDTNVIVLEFADVKDANIRNAVGEVSIQYIGTMLEGVDGPVLGFRKKFTPEGLYMKPNPNDLERMQIVGATMSGRLTAITYSDAKAPGEHLQLIGAELTSAKLTHINDL